MTETITTDAPMYVKQNIEATKVKKQAEELIKSTREATVEYFRLGGTYPGVTFTESKSEPLCSEVIVKWVYANLPKETYDELFTKVFDPNSFAKLVAEGKIDVSKLPSEYRETKYTPKLSVKS